MLMVRFWASAYVVQELWKGSHGYVDDARHEYANVRDLAPHENAHVREFLSNASRHQLPLEALLFPS